MSERPSLIAFRNLAREWLDCDGVPRHLRPILEALISSPTMTPVPVDLKERTLAIAGLENVRLLLPDRVEIRT